MIPLVDLKAQYAALAEDIDVAIKKVLRKTDFILGEDVSEFEKEFGDFVGASYAVGVASGTDALYLALLAAGVKPADEVITAANTFIATALAISYAGARPVFVDVDEKTRTMQSWGVEKAISGRTKAIIPVHLYGQPADMDPILSLAAKNGIIVVEDACQSHGSLYKGKATGTLGTMGCFSFYPGKNLGAYGDGGLITTNDPDLAGRLRILRNYGQQVKYHHLYKGFNSRLDTMQAAILRVKLKRLKQWNEDRAKRAMLYNSMLAGLDVVLPHQAEYGTHVYHLYVIRARNRDELLAFLGTQGISAGIHYPIPLHLQEAFADLGYKTGDFPVTELLAREIISLPIYPELSEDHVREVVGRIREFYCIVD